MPARFLLTPLRGLVGTERSRFILGLLTSLLETRGFPPRWACGSAWTSTLGWIHIASDLLIFLAYAAIPIALVYLARHHREIYSQQITWLFAAFILCCGTGHLLEAIIFWHPVYRLAGGLKMVTAFVSWATVLALIPLIPKVLAMRTPEDYEALLEQRSQAEAQLSESLQRLEHSNRELERFAYVASHDLQEPLRAVSSYSQLLEQRLADRLDDDEREFLGYVEDGAQRMSTLIKDLLAYSRVNTRRAPPGDCDLNRVLDTVEADLVVALQENDGTLEVGMLPTVPADEGQIRQVFQNLVANALKFRRERAPPRVRVSAEDEGASWRLAVEDNGIGIPKEYRGKVFEVFKRLHGRSEYPGNGIGLAICARIVEFHGGEIWVEDSEMGGARFNVRLPKVPPKIPEVELPKEGSLGS